MSESARHLENLVELAKEPSEERRRELLEQVTNLFFEGTSKFNPTEIDYFGDIMGKVAFDLEMQVREQLAIRLSKAGNAPLSLVKMLADDEISVAAPILSESVVLGDTDLINIIQRKSQEHMLAISARRDVSETVSGELVEHGNDRVLETLVSNSGARFTGRTMDTVVTRAESNSKLHKPLVVRRDMPPELTHKMFWFVSSALRTHILTTSPDVNDEELDAALAESRAEMDALLNKSEKEMDRAELYAKNKDELGQLDEGHLLYLLRQGQVPTFVGCFARMTRIDTKTANRILHDHGGEAAAVACRAARFKNETYSNMMLLTDNTGKRTGANLGKLTDLYDKLDPATAQRTMRFWRLRAKTRKP